MFNDLKHIVLLNDLDKYNEGEKVCITGVIIDRWKNKRSGGFGIKLKDLTGVATVKFQPSFEYKYEDSCFYKTNYIRIYGEITIQNNEHIVSNISKIEKLEEIYQWINENDTLDQSSSIFISKISSAIKGELYNLTFVEVNTRIISRFIGEYMMEPLQANYPGYGAPAFLSPSPSSQLSEFLAITLLPRVFTQTISITQSYRFPNGSTETPIIMAKAVDLPKGKDKEIIHEITRSVLSELTNNQYSFSEITGEWDDYISRAKNTSNENGFILYSYNAKIPTIGQRWTSELCKLRQLVDDSGNLLVECSTEILSNDTRICTISFYPSQFLNCVKRAPTRQLLNLWKLFDGGNVYV